MLFLLFIRIVDEVGCSLSGHSLLHRIPDEPRERNTDGIIIYSDQIEKIKQYHCGG